MSVLDTAARGWRQQRRRQRRPVALHPRGVPATGFPPLPAHALERLESRLYPEPERAPRRPRLRRVKVGQYDPRRRLTIEPDDGYRLPKPFRRGSERGSAPDEGAVRSQNRLAGGHPRPVFGAKSRVYRLSHVRMPAERAYLFPQIRASQAAVRHHDHPQRQNPSHQRREAGADVCLIRGRRGADGSVAEPLAEARAGGGESTHEGELGGDGGLASALGGYGSERPGGRILWSAPR